MSKLIWGYSHSDFEVRRVCISADLPSELRILYLSDFHFTKYSGNIAARLLAVVTELDPEIILLGGDYIDFKSGEPYFQAVLKEFALRKNVYAIAGNHDYFYGINKLKKLFAAYNIGFIEKKSVSFSCKGMHIRLDGNVCTRRVPADLSILCLHHPLDLSLFAADYDLAFAGHLHGSQVVFWQNERGLYPGRLFYKWNRLGAKSANCHYFISKGLGDTLPLRYCCAKELIFCTLSAKV